MQLFEIKERPEAGGMMERSGTHEALQRSQTLARMVGRLGRMGAWTVDLPGLNVIFSDEVCAIHEVPPGFSPSVAEAIHFYAPEFRPLITAAFGACVSDGTPFDIQLQLVTARGRRIWVRSIGEAERDATGVIHCVQGAFQDITAHKQLEAQLAHAQKMETVGRLAGGFAHEFNSLLTAIIGQSELLLGDLPVESTLAKGAVEIRKAADRAATLTKQFLAYGRKQILQPETLDLRHIIAGMQDMLRHLMGETVDVRIIASEGGTRVKVDAAQFEQVVLNMVLNARDAMTRGGRLTLETSEVVLGQEGEHHCPGLKLGSYVMVTVTDTGSGMDREVMSHMFEPFFSTKEVGKGTGLGLAACYGIVKQSGGHITVESQLHRGTTFKIYLPGVPGDPKAGLSSAGPSKFPRGTETILLVESDAALREMASTLLRRLGYIVLAASDGMAALEMVEQRGGEFIHLLCTDVGSPPMNGEDLSCHIRALFPQARILFTSAFAEPAAFHQGTLHPGAALLQKPLTPAALAGKVRELLGHDG